jgi:hypothetical protein
LAELQGTLDVNVTNAVISVSQSGAWTVTANQGTSPWVISGTVNVGNFPATQNVAVTSIVEVEVKNDTGNPLPVTGTVTITDGSGPVTVDGTVTANQGTSPWIVDTTATTRTPALIRATGSGTISAGARSISVFNAGAAAGSILGVASNILPGEVFEFSAGGENDTLSAFAYDGTGTTLVITSIV